MSNHMPEEDSANKEDNKSNSTSIEDNKFKCYMWRAKVASFTWEYKIDKFTSVKNHPPGSELLSDALVTLMFYSDEATVANNELPALV